MSQFLPDVRTYAGVPPVGAFASILGTPIVINTVTNTPYYLAPGDIVTPLGGGGGAGTVTSVAATVPSLLSVSGSPITGAGTLAFTYSGTPLPIANGGTGAAAPALVPGTNITITGSWPNQTISAAGGGLTNWTEALKTATPYTTTTAAVSFMVFNATATNIVAAIVPKGLGGVQAAVADGTAAGGNIRGGNSVDWQTVRTTAAQVCGGAQGVLGGGINNTVGGTTNVLLGGNGNTAGGATSVSMVGGTTNTGTADNCVVVGGLNNNNSGVVSAIGGGNSNTITQRGSAIAGGETNQISIQNGAIPGGKGNIVDGIYSFAMGNTARTRGLWAVDAWCSGNTQFASKVQALRMRLLEQTTTATPKVLTADQSGTPSNTNQYGLNPSMVCCVIGKITGRTAAGVTSAWTFTAAIKQQTNNAGTALVGVPTVVLVGQDAGATTWGTPTITADVTNGAMAITVTGAAATINWVATIDAAENTF